MHESEPQPLPGSPESAWRSIESKEKLEMDFAPDQLYAMAHSRERQSIQVYRIAAILSVCFAAVFFINAVRLTEPAVRLGQAWMAGMLCLFFWKLIRQKPLRMDPSESCARFLEGEFEARHRSLLEIRRVVFLLVPAIVASWWGGGLALRLQALGVDPASLGYRLATGPWLLVVFGVLLALIWLAFGSAARKAVREQEELQRRARE